MTTRAGSAVGLFAVMLALCLAAAAWATDYVVDPSGDDADAGDSGAPWRTVAKAAATVQAGDTVTIRPGTYRESVWFAGSGQPAAPIVFTAQPGAVFISPDPSASKEAFNIAGGGYIRLVGFEATGGFDETIFVRSGSHDIEITNCTLYGNHLGILLADASNVTITGCTLHHNVRAGIRFAGSTHDVTVTDTESFGNDDGLGCNGEADGFAADTAGSVANVSFVRTRAYSNGEDGFDVAINGVTFDQVESFDNNCAGFKLWRSAEVTNSLVYGNHLGIGTTSLSGNTTVTIANCTLVDNAIGVQVNKSLVTRTRYYANVWNNIIIGPDRALDVTDAVTLTEGRNVLWRGNLDGALIQRTVGTRNLRYTGHAINGGIWARQTHQGNGTLAVDADLVDPARANFAPSATSAAADRARVDVAPFTDFNGTIRPQGAGPDIGAVEIADPIANHRPLADAGAATRIGRAKRLLLFNSAGSLDPDGTPLTFSWDFGDGSLPSTKVRALHAFATAGTYTVRLTVSDGQLTSTATVTVTIT